MPTIPFIGAGSMAFAKRLSGGILSCPELEDSETIPMNIEERRLDRTAEIAEAMVENAGLPAKIEATTNRREALDDAEYVRNTINVGGTEPFEHEIPTPERYAEADD